MDFETRENFSIDPIGFVKNQIKNFVIFLLRVVIIGFLIWFILKKSGLSDDHSIKNYLVYFFIASIVMYIFTILYFMFQCYRKNIEIGKMNYKEFAKSSLLGPSVILFHIIFLIVCGLIEPTPEFGLILYMFSWSAIGVILIAGVAYNIAFDVAYLKTSCASS